jgi:hypothetical protein
LPRRAPRQKPHFRPYRNSGAARARLSPRKSIAFFETYNDLKGNRFEVIAIAGPDRAVELVAQAAWKVKKPPQFAGEHDQTQDQSAG